MRSKKLVLNALLVVTALAVPGCAKIVVVPVTGRAGAKVAGEGVFYALPNTVARIAPKLSKEVRTGARYDQFAAIFVPDGDPVCAAPVECVSEKDDDGIPQPPTRTRYSIDDGATISSFGEPDPESVFMVRFSGGGTIDQSLTMAWTDTGLLSSATSTVTNRGVDVALAGLKVAATLGSKLAAGAEKAGEPALPPCNDPPTRFDGEVIHELARAEDAAGTLIANYCDIAPQIRERMFTETAQNPKPLSRLRQAVSAFIVRVQPLVQDRAEILSGMKPVLAPADLLAKVDALVEDQLKSLFLGSKTVTTWEPELEFRDFKDWARTKQETPLLRIHPGKGVCLNTAIESAASKPAPKGFAVLAEDACRSIGDVITVSFGLKLYPEKQLFHTVQANVADPVGELSFRYRLPAQVIATLTAQQTTKGKDGKDSTTVRNRGTAILSVSQLGITRALPAKRSAKSMTYELGLVEATGALKTFKLGTTGGLDATTIDALGGVAGTAADARNAARKQAADAADEVNVLTRQQSLLKLKDEICELQKKYGIDCTVRPN